MDTAPPITTLQMYQIHETFYTKIKGLFVCEYDEVFVMTFLALPAVGVWVTLGNNRIGKLLVV
jgi:hypothetical protein